MDKSAAGKKGFTLFELAIVLVIIAILAGAIVAGQSLIRAAEVNRFMSDMQALTVAANNFKTKYGALPGDFRSASTVWPTPCAGMAGGSATCNGDGNGLVGALATQGGGVYTMNVGSAESINFYFHLYLAGMIKGPATGCAYHDGLGSCAWWMSPGKYDKTVYNHTPAYHLFSKSVAALPSQASFSPTTPGTPYPTQNIYYLTKGSIGGQFNIRSFAGYDVYTLDSKYDDGLADSGRIRSWQLNTGCFNGGYSQYKMSETTANDAGPNATDNNGCTISMWAGY